MITAYHATTCAAAAGIIASGTFRAGTYWAYDPADALGFAGPVLFVGRFDETLLRGADDEIRRTGKRPV